MVGAMSTGGRGQTEDEQVKEKCTNSTEKVTDKESKKNSRVTVREFLNRIYFYGSNFGGL